jgi:hypothetical protein
MEAETPADSAFYTIHTHHTKASSLSVLAPLSCFLAKNGIQPIIRQHAYQCLVLLFYQGNGNKSIDAICSIKIYLNGTKARNKKK